MQAEGGIDETVTVTGIHISASYAGAACGRSVCAAFLLVQYCWHWAVDVC